MNEILRIENVSKNFGGVKALRNINLNIKDNQITGIIGPNGAGKSTLFNLIVGIYKPDNGDVYFDNELISNKKNYQIHRLGIARTFQNIRLFNNMTILDNVLSGRYIHKKNSNEERKAEVLSEKLLKEINLYNFKYDYPSSLDYGSKKKLEIIRALISEPKLLMLDEPAAGMNETETKDLMNFIKKISTNNITILIIEHDMRLMMNLCDEINVLNFGELIANGSPNDVSHNESVREAYLGKDFNHAGS